MESPSFGWERPVSSSRPWWRYGRELPKRKALYESKRSKVTAYTFGAMAYVSEMIGLTDGDVAIDWEDAPVAYIL